MFRHKGRRRTFKHNLKLASLLSFVAGIVNVSGLFAIQKLTTNVTGHFAFFADEMAKGNYGKGLVYLLYILAFFSGALFSNFVVEAVSRKTSRFVNVIPVACEVFILLTIAVLNPETIRQHGDLVACLLLFSMGLQNALVTSLSNSVVRTTHLTGLFTDLGIEVSQLFFYRGKKQQIKLRSSIRLRMTIIFFFFFGGVLGGAGYLVSGIHIILAAVATLLFALAYDSLKLGLVKARRMYTR